MFANIDFNNNGTEKIMAENKYNSCIVKNGCIRNSIRERRGVVKLIYTILHCWF